MSITFVMGPMGVGKSTYIKENILSKNKDVVVIDLYDYQQNKILDIDGIWQSYLDCLEDVIKAINDNKDVVMEHTLLKAIRREFYIEKIREVTNEPIEVILIKPPLKVIRERWKKRDIYFDDFFIRANLDTLEIPTLEEGFSKVTIIEDF